MERRQRAGRRVYSQIRRNKPLSFEPVPMNQGRLSINLPMVRCAKHRQRLRRTTMTPEEIQQQMARVICRGEIMRRI